VEALLGLRGGGRAKGRVEANQPFSSVKPAPAACPACAVVHHQIAELSNLSGNYKQGYAKVVHKERATSSSSKEITTK